MSRKQKKSENQSEQKKIQQRILFITDSLQRNQLLSKTMDLVEELEMNVLSLDHSKESQKTLNMLVFGGKGLSPIHFMFRGSR